MKKIKKMPYDGNADACSTSVGSSAPCKGAFKLV